MLLTLAESCVGSGHVKARKPLQDFCAALSDKSRRYAYALAADGHGGEKYFRSDVGAKTAVKCARECMDEMMKDFFPYVRRKEKNFVEKNIQLLTQKIPLLWRKRVKAHFDENPLTDAEKEICVAQKIPLPLSDDDVPVVYGATLVAAACFEREGFWFAVQIGDGKCVVIKNGNDGATRKIVESPVPEDEKLGFGVTTSLCSKNAGAEFRFAFGFEKIAGLAVMTDGMADSFDAQKLPAFILNVRDKALADLEKTKADLKEFLPTLSEKGSGDDISVAAIFQKA